MGLILLVDMDYFFAACEESRHPDLKDKPLVVGTAPAESKEHGVVQTCNYVARKFGIRSAMPTAQALKLNPGLIYLHSDEPFYEQMSKRVVEIIRSYGFNIEMLSIDEVAVDSANDNYDSAIGLAGSIKERINHELGLPCTIGISTSKAYAKMVCDAYKPGRIGMVRNEDLTDFLKEKDVGAIPGVGPKTKQRLGEINVKSIGDLAGVDVSMLIEKFGRFGGELHLIAIGDDRSGIAKETDVVSIGRERTIDETSDIDVIGKKIMDLAKETFEELNRKQMRFGAVGAKVRYSDFTIKTKIKKLSKPSDSLDIAYSACIALIRPMVLGRKVRKVGIRLTDLKRNSGQMKI